MPPRRRFGKRLIKSFLPIALVIVLAVVGALSFVVYCVSRPAKRPYVVTPESFSRISGRAIKVTDETWTNRDGRNARGWLLKGAEGAPAVVLLHRYGGDRSWLFNLGVKINETTNFTILWPDLRGHGENPPIKWTALGGREGDDLLDALQYLRGLKSENQKTLVGERFGVYGVELGAYSALKAARGNDQIKVLVLDSVVKSPNDLLNTAIVELRWSREQFGSVFFTHARCDFICWAVTTTQTRVSLRGRHETNASFCFQAQMLGHFAKRLLHSKAASLFRPMSKRAPIFR